MTSEERKALVNVIGCILDHPSIYMGGPSFHARRKAEAILPEIEKLREADGQRIAELKAALGLFVADERFDVHIGGNPSAVEAAIAQAHAAYLGETK